ncbi:hypothetical protein GDO86_015876 [Hymenochirus boettgeri]|uniref:CLOCK-interacting pacemaker n=1 Tax=Hymenochirus boettgeri TaxID=247094 RepID=A0A8T2K2V2_9PIPI|nr:hypothetical protein GDO86_015876 [Hymenochirus boettgeri]
MVCFFSPSDVASECLSSVEQTDSEEGPTTSRWNVAKACSGQPASRPPSLVVLQNLHVGQGSSPDPNVSSWAVRPSFQLLQTSSQILLFPPTISSAKASTCIKGDKYLPILKSYTKIAPQPSHHSSNLTLPCKRKRGAEERAHNQFKRHCKGHSGSRKGSDTTSDLLDAGIQESQHSVTESSDSTKKKELDITVPCLNISLPEKESGVSSCLDTQQNLLNADQQNKSRRFQNTLDILHRSGLLDIAMKTKELARLNQVTQSQLEKLQEQVQLYVNAVESSHPQDWQILQNSLTSEGGQENTTNVSIREANI